MTAVPEERLGTRSWLAPGSSLCIRAVLAGFGRAGYGAPVPTVSLPVAAVSAATANLIFSLSIGPFPAPICLSEI
uniref:Uncharacterized protein n=1 Tax=Sphaerodactylus townsendi TaxID=933632 RepID=A0ACB8FB76_9SAUR